MKTYILILWQKLNFNIKNSIIIFLIIILIFAFYYLNLKKDEINSLKDLKKGHEDKISELIEINKTENRKIFKFLSNLSDGYIEFNIKRKSTEIIKTKFNNSYLFESYRLPIPNKSLFDSKPLGYMEGYKDKIILITGDGNIFFFDSVINYQIKLLSLRSNIKNYSEFTSGSPVSIKDIMILEDKLLVSYTKEVSNNCYNTSILEANINFKFLNFKEYFTYDECSNKTNHFPIKSGGRMSEYYNGKIIFSIGEYETYTNIAQDKNSLFGKIIEIDTNTKSHEILSVGHRNSLGLLFDLENEILISTDNGPKGGDEINLDIKPNSNKYKNFGWPISSYGNHYDNQFRELSPLYDSHIKYGNVEPLKFFINGIGISQVVKLNKFFGAESGASYFVSSLGYDDSIKNGGRTIHHIKLSDDYKNISFEEKIVIGERIRDIIINDNLILMILENSASLGILKKIN